MGGEEVIASRNGRIAGDGGGIGGIATDIVEEAIADNGVFI